MSLAILWLFASVAAASPGLPRWPREFSANYVSFAKNTTGRFVVKDEGGHDASQLITFQDGTLDHLCSHYFNHTACNQLTAGGFRYLVFPQVKSCCKCCAYRIGTYECGGPLASTWLNNASGNLFYEGRVNVLTSKLYKWKVVGLSEETPNFYYDHADSRRLPAIIDGYNYLDNPSQRSDDEYQFDSDSFKFSVDNSVFRVPDICLDAAYCGGKVCASSPANLSQTD
mmetsp:Transcript_10040/g.16435  ORF Transcript_10040/g.16435 Transcript_10040/m.16435 type:complete len:227 (+) Transcript_10040:211-891(+)